MNASIATYFLNSQQISLFKNTISQKQKKKPWRNNVNSLKQNVHKHTKKTNPGSNFIVIACRNRFSDSSF